MLHGNVQVGILKDLLLNEGYALKSHWYASRDIMGRSYKDVICALVQPLDGKDPAAGRSVIIIDHGPDGFGLYVEASSNRIEENVRQIIGRLATVGELVNEETRYTKA